VAALRAAEEAERAAGAAPADGDGLREDLRGR
jgi:hypothetical protein